MTKSEFLKIITDTYQEKLKTIVPDIEAKFNDKYNEQNEIPNHELICSLFVKSIEINSSITAQILAKVLEFDD